MLPGPTNARLNRVRTLQIPAAGRRSRVAVVKFTQSGRCHPGRTICFQRFRRMQPTSDTPHLLIVSGGTSEGCDVDYETSRYRSGRGGIL